MTKTTIKQILTKARGLLLKYGWQKYDIGEKGGKMCAMGAINMAMHGDPDYRYTRTGRAKEEPVAGFLLKALGLPLDDLEDQSACGIARWNNEDCNRRADVLKGFDKAIKLAAKK